MEAETVII